jgi:hypothetical protein
MKFVKKLIPVAAERMNNPFVIHTLEGDMKGNGGDWVITGVHGEQYPIKNDIFRETYDPADDETREALAVMDDLDAILQEANEEECVCIPFPVK